MNGVGKTELWILRLRVLETFPIKFSLAHAHDVIVSERTA